MSPRAAPTLLARILAGAALAGIPIVAAPARGHDPQPAPSGAPHHRGHDRFDEIRTIDELRELEREVEEVAGRVRDSVVLLLVREGSRVVASGTAVVIGEDGLLATCGHVGRRPGRAVTAVFSDGSELRGRTLGQVFEGAIDCGLAQLETEGRALSVAPLGTTRGLEPGDWVIAAGYTHGLREEPRPALVRVGRVLERHDDGLFFDAPIDAGDSGGPSFNLRGEVVGLNSRCGRWSWQNLATPIDALIERMEELRHEVDRDQQEGDGPVGEARTRTARPPEDRAATPARRRGDDAVRFPSNDHGAGRATVERELPLVEAAAAVEASMVRVHSGGRAVAYGAVIEGGGLVVTKASQLEPDSAIAVQIGEDEWCDAEVVARDAETDLALLRVTLVEGDWAGADGSPEGSGADGPPRSPLRAVEWAMDAPVVPGTVLITPRPFSRRPLLGFAAIEGRESVSDPIDGPYLGVQSRVAAADSLSRVGAEHGVSLMRVLPGTPAAEAGLEPGDLILTIDGVEVRSPDHLRRLLGRRQPGERISLAVVDERGQRTLDISLARRGDLDRRARRGNTATPISRRSSGLGSLFAHDAVTEPTDMGGPVIDLDGRVVGLNIARYDRTATHALSAERVAAACRRMLDEVRERR